MQLELKYNDNLWCFLFCKEDVTFLQGVLKKLLTQPCYKVIFLFEYRTQILNKGMPVFTTY